MPLQTLDCKPNQADAVQEWNVPPGTASSPRAKFLYRLGAPQRWWQDSRLRIAAQEIRAFPQRISVALRTPHLRFGYCLLSCSEDRSTGTLREVSEFVRACSSDMRRLQANHRWAGVLDLEIAAQSYRAGADWATRTMLNCKKRGDVVSALSCDQVSQVPDTGANASGHSRGDSQAGMDADEIIVREV
jgi:hypothetical protein